MNDFSPSRLQHGHTIIITGASSDIGFEITRRFVDLGVNVVAHYASDGSKLLPLLNDHILVHKADLRRDSEAKGLVDATIEKFGKIDALINTIGPFQESDLLSMEPSSWREMIELNLNITFSMSHYAMPFLIESKGQILNFAYAGVDSITPWPQATAYAAAKSGVAILTKSLAQSLGAKGVRVNAISPGWIEFGKFSSEKRSEIKMAIPMGRLGKPSEVVDLAQWILTASPEFMTGALIPLAGALEF